jgi:hypothetical protein
MAPPLLTNILNYLGGQASRYRPLKSDIIEPFLYGLYLRDNLGMDILSGPPKKLKISEKEIRQEELVNRTSKFIDGGRKHFGTETIEWCEKNKYKPIDWLKFFRDVILLDDYPSYQPIGTAVVEYNTFQNDLNLILSALEQTDLLNNYAKSYTAKFSKYEFNAYREHKLLEALKVLLAGQKDGGLDATVLLRRVAASLALLLTGKNTIAKNTELTAHIELIKEILAQENLDEENRKLLADCSFQIEAYQLANKVGWVQLGLEIIRGKLWVLVSLPVVLTALVYYGINFHEPKVPHAHHTDPEAYHANPHSDFDFIEWYGISTTVDSSAGLVDSAAYWYEQYLNCINLYYEFPWCEFDIVEYRRKELDFLVRALKFDPNSHYIKYHIAKKIVSFYNSENELCGMTFDSLWTPFLYSRIEIAHYTVIDNFKYMNCNSSPIDSLYSALSYLNDAIAVHQDYEYYKLRGAIKCQLAELSRGITYETALEDLYRADSILDTILNVDLYEENRLLNEIRKCNCSRDYFKSGIESFLENSRRKEHNWGRKPGISNIIRAQYHLMEHRYKEAIIYGEKCIAENQITKFMSYKARNELIKENIKAHLIISASYNHLANTLIGELEIDGYETRDLNNIDSATHCMKMSMTHYDSAMVEYNYSPPLYWHDAVIKSKSEMARLESIKLGIMSNPNITFE